MHTALVCRDSLVPGRTPIDRQNHPDRRGRIAALGKELAGGVHGMLRIMALCALAILAAGVSNEACAQTAQQWAAPLSPTHYPEMAPLLAAGPGTQLDSVISGAGGPAPGQLSADYYSTANQSQRENQERRLQQQLELQRAQIEAAITAKVEADSRPPQHEYDPRSGRYIVVLPRAEFPARTRRPSQPVSGHSTDLPHNRSGDGVDALPPED
jgi:hypothetical protein